jgi:hypothetical protein
VKKTFLIACVAFLMVAGTLLAVPFTLRNDSLASIPLDIPGVKNPNLSPMSSGGVDLAVGQKAFFYVKKKKYLLLEVTDALKDQKLDVGKLIVERGRELGI